LTAASASVDAVETQNTGQKSGRQYWIPCPEEVAKVYEQNGSQPPQYVLPTIYENAGISPSQSKLESDYTPYYVNVPGFRDLLTNEEKEKIAMLLNESEVEPEVQTDTSEVKNVETEPIVLQIDEEVDKPEVTDVKVAVKTKATTGTTTVRGGAYPYVYYYPQQGEKICT